MNLRGMPDDAADAAKVVDDSVAHLNRCCHIFYQDPMNPAHHQILERALELRWTAERHFWGVFRRCMEEAQ